MLALPGSLRKGRSEVQSVKVERDLSGHADADLVALVRDGNGPAFAAIMQRYNPRLYRVARGVIRDDAEAEDVLQEAYVRAYAALGEFRGALPFDPPEIGKSVRLRYRSLRGR